jgi:threonine dehydratase
MTFAPFSLTELEQVAAEVYQVISPTPQYCWPLLSKELGTEVWVKHENHHPVGAFKIRGGVVLLRHWADEGVRQVIAATRGNHGQSIGFAARHWGIQAQVVVPHGNSVEKNQAMRALGVDLIEHGHDFQAALEEAQRRAALGNARLVPSF